MERPKGWEDNEKVVEPSIQCPEKPRGRKKKSGGEETNDAAEVKPKRKGSEEGWQRGGV